MPGKVDPVTRGMMIQVAAQVDGHAAAASIAKKAHATGKTVRQVALEKKVLDEAQLDAALHPRTMTEPS